VNLPTRPVRIGLTGGIGSGKSTVAGLLAQRGATVIDADAIARACTQPGGAAMAPIAKVFGSSAIGPDGALDRDRIRSLVFQDPDARRRLEAIIHPLVRSEMEAQCRVATTDCVVLDIPLLVESPHWRDRVHTVWVVDCTADTQRQRVMRRNGWSAAQVEAVMQTQATRAQRLAVADVVIDNDQATLEQLETRVRIAFQETRQRFGL